MSLRFTFSCLVIAIAATPVYADVPPFPVTSCPAYKDTRPDQIARGVCAARKFAPLVSTVASNKRRDYANQVCEAEIPCVVGVCHVARNVCKGLLDPQCNHGGIEQPPDGPAFRNAACRVPRAECSTAPNDEEKKLCNEIKPFVPPEGVFDPGTSTTRESFNPRFVPLAVLYSPPGKDAKVTYGNGSTLGIRQEFTASFGAGVAFDAGGPVAKTEGEFMETVGSGHAYEVRKTSTHTLSVNSQVDFIDHEKDMFLLWMNPTVSAERTLYPGNRSLTRVTQGTRNSEPAKTVLVAAYQLRDPSKLPPQIKPLFANWTRADYDTVLKLNPFTGGTWSNERFQPVEQIQIDGPVSAQDNFISYQYSFEDEQSRSATRMNRQSMALSVEVGPALAFFVELHVLVGGKFTFDITSSDATTTGKKQVASYDLASKTVGHHDVVDVYFDTLFNTFAFKSRGQVASTPAMTGLMTTPNGQPASNQTVTMTFSDGTQRRIQTDAKGAFQVYSPPQTSGNVAITTADGTTTVAMGSSPQLKVSGSTAKYAKKPPKATISNTLSPEIRTPIKPIRKPGM